MLDAASSGGYEKASKQVPVADSKGPARGARRHGRVKFWYALTAKVL